MSHQQYFNALIILNAKENIKNKFFRRLIAPNVQKKVFLAGGATATSTSASQVQIPSNIPPLHPRYKYLQIFHLCILGTNSSKYSASASQVPTPLNIPPLRPRYKQHPRYRFL
jgi:hypothetical protein